MQQTNYTIPAEAGPSRQPLQTSPPGRSNSFTHRQREKMPMPPPIDISAERTWAHTPSQQHLNFPTHPHTSGPRYDYHMVPDSPTPSSLRRAASDEGGNRSRAYTESHIRPPSIDSTQAALLQNVREKMSNQDQEAMKRLRETMAAQATARPAVDPMSPTGDRFPSRPKMSQEALDKGGGGVRRSGTGEELGNDIDKAPRPLNVQPDTVKEGSRFAIAVLGHPGVGKTTVVRRAAKAWGVSDPVLTTLSGNQRMLTYQSHVLPGGKIKESHKVDYIELDMAALDVSSSTNTWAEGVGQISGVILCYDATRASTLNGLPEALKKLSTSGTPMIILACKSDPEAPSEVDAAYANSLGETHNIGLIEVTAQTPEGKSKMRNGLRWLMFKLEQRDRKQTRLPSNIDLRHVTTSQIQPIKPLPPDIDLQSPVDSDGHSSGGDRIMWGQHSRGSGATTGNRSEERSSSGSLQWIMTVPVEVEGSVARPELEEGDISQKEVDVAGLEGTAGKLTSETPEPALWLNMEDLYRKVFSCIVTKENMPLVSSFFLTYRRFATPLEVMREFRVRFEDVSVAELSKDIKMLVLQRLLGALVEWACEYPGDIVDDKVQAVYREILAATLRFRYLNHLAAELVTIESQLLDVEDIDTSWSFKLGVTSSITESDTSHNLPITNGDVPHKADPTPISAPKPPTSFASTHAASSSIHSLGSSISHEGKPPLLGLRQRSGSDPRLLTSVPPPISGLHESAFARWSGAWNSFVRYDPRTFAVDLTKLQWQRFAMIRPRDIFRHDFGQEKDGPVGYSIEFFNHVSRWVSTIILANPKPKHRARTYERFIEIVHHLRRLNNYDSLYAVISGMREASIHRLSQTHALINLPPSALAEFEAHVSLMDPRRGYAEYNKAFEVDMSHGASAIPLLTVVLGQINRLQSARPADKREDGSVQWDKFLLFGQILSVISSCQQRGAMIPGEPSPAFQALMENTRAIDSEDALFERSRMVEPPNGPIPNGGVLKKLAKISLQAATRTEADFVAYI